MALKTINDLTALTTPASTDLIGVWNVSAGRMRKSTLAQVVQYGGALLTTAANTVTLANWSTAFGLTLANGDNGADGAGQSILIGRNTNASGAAGSLALGLRGGGARYIWVDATSVVRTDSDRPTTSASDTGGTVVGAQTSHISYKNVLGAPIDDVAALANVVAGAGDVRRFTYRSGAYNSQEFSGVVLDGDALHRYGEDADAAHPAGKSLNVINAIGDLLMAVRELDRRLAALEA